MKGKGTFSGTKKQEREREWCGGGPVVTVVVIKPKRTCSCCVASSKTSTGVPLLFFCTPTLLFFFAIHLPVFLFWGGEREKKNDKNIFIKKTTSFIFLVTYYQLQLPWWPALFRGPTKNLLFAFLYVEEMLVKS